MKRQFIFIVLLSLSLALNAGSHKFAIETETIIYKEVDGVQLEMTVYRPVMQEGKRLPAIVFFFGGGWENGTPTQFEMQARYLASRGMVAFCPDYRVQSRQGTTPFECVKDAKSAIRFIKGNAIGLGIDPEKIVSSGGSAGGHLAACTALINDYNETSDNLSVSPVPTALVLFNPAIDTGDDTPGKIKKFLGKGIEISPTHHIREDLPPTLILSGENDSITPFKNMLNFQQIMLEHGNVCKVIGYEDQGHGFLNFTKSPKFFKRTLNETELFLEELGLLTGKSWLNEYFRNIQKLKK